MSAPAPPGGEPGPASGRPVLRIGNASGFYGDRFAAVEEMLTGGPLDVLTGDYLAELTLLILGRDRAKDAARGYARTFLRQLETCLGLALDRGVRVVTNAGGLNPAGLAAALHALAARLGLTVRIGHVTGDDLLPRAEELGFPGALTANAYLGAFGIVACLDAGADVVVTGRVTDASLVVGPAAAHFGWGRDDLDALAGATVAGHVLECGAHATGGNYAFFTELDARRPGFPLAEIAADGSCVVTKHPGTGGTVTVGTVTAQLLYEIGAPGYVGPDVVTALDSVRLADVGPDRVAVTGVRGAPPPPTLKVGLTTLGGFRNAVTFVLTGLDVEAKAALVRAQLTDALGEVGPRSLTWTLARTDSPDADTQEEASALLHVVAKDPDATRAGRSFSGAAVEGALSSYPGFTLTAPPADATPYGVFRAASVPQDLPAHAAVLPDGAVVAITPPATTAPLPTGRLDGDAARDAGTASAVAPSTPDRSASAPGTGPTRRVPVGRVLGARSGDKGGDANLGVWARADAAYAWLAGWLDADRVRTLLPEARELDVEVHLLPNLRAVNVVLPGLLGEGVSAGTRFDPQAKGLGEWFRSRYADVPVTLLPTPDAAPATGAAP